MIAIFRRWLLPIVILLFGIGCFTLLMIFQAETPATEVQAKVWPVYVLPVKLGNASPVITVYGTVENASALSVAAVARSYVQSLPVREGQLVKQGDELVILDQRDFDLRISATRATVARLQAEIASQKLVHQADQNSHQHELQVLALKQQALIRAKSLKQRNLGSQVTIDQADEAYQQQQLVVVSRGLALNNHPQQMKQLVANLTQAQVDLEIARLDLERSKVSAPYDAIVGSLRVAAGDHVESNQVLLKIYPLQEMQVRAKIPAPYLVELVSLQEVGADQQTEPLTATVAEFPVLLKLDQLAGEADARGIDALFITESPQPFLRVGMALTLSLNLPLREQVMSVPYDALYGNDRAYKVVDEHLQSIRVKRVGDAQSADGSLWALVQSADLQDGDQLLTTHLPNAVNGLPVSTQPFKL